MRPSRIQSPGWNLALLKLLLGAAFLVPLRSDAQCASGYAAQTVTYTSTLSGGGSDGYDIAIPQYFSSEGYTLLSATINVYLTTTATVKFQNTNSNAQNFTPAIGRSDYVSLDGVPIAGGGGSGNLPFTSLTPQGSAGDNTTYTNKPIFNNYNIISNYTLDNSNPDLNLYQGTGNITFHYTTATYINNVNTGVTATPTITDNFTFSVTYSFCQPTILSANIITFTATRQNDQTVAVNWIVANEEAGRKYNVEVSDDGSKYTSFDSLNSDPVNTEASYSDIYRIQPGTTGKLYFRLRQVNVSGEVSYSSVRIIDLGAGSGTGAGSGFSIYPNPASDYINLLFPSGVQGWQVDIISADGSLVQRDFYYNTSSGRLNFQRKLSSGTYFARATDQQTAKSYVAPFVIR